LSSRLLVLDASAAVYLTAMDGTWSGFARYVVHAPPLMWSETLSGLCKAAHRGEMSGADLDRALGRLEALPVVASAADAIHRRDALEIARKFGWAKTYDAEYVALAKTLGCPVLTTDQRLRRGAGRVVDIVGPSDV
jgi:predicted nucleic acid-binding protein